MEENRKFGPTRGSIICIINEVWKIIATAFGVFLLMLIQQDFEVLGGIAFFVICILISPIAKTIQYFSTTYTVTEKSFLVKSGILVKRTMEIPLEVITTVDFGQNLFYQIFQCYKVKIDNASQGVNKQDKAEIVVSLSKKDAFYLKELLEEKRTESVIRDVTDAPDYTTSENRNNNIVSLKMNVMDIFLLGVFSCNIFTIVQVLVVGVPVLGVLTSIFSGISDSDAVFDNMWEWIETGKVAAVALVLIVLIVINFIYAIITSLLRYYPFQVQVRDADIKIEYGLLSKKTYTFSRRKISGIKRKQSILMRIFGYETLELLVVGYGDASDQDKVKEVPLLVPIIQVRNSEDILTKLFKDYQEEKEMYPADKRGLPFYFLTFRMFLAIILMGVTFFVSQVAPFRIWFIILAAFMIFSIWMEYKATKIYVSKHYIMVAYGSFQIERKLIPWNKIEVISGYGSIWKQKMGLISLLFSANAPLADSKIRAKNINKEVMEKVIEKMPL